jgi:hypothetical protein
MVSLKRTLLTTVFIVVLLCITGSAVASNGIQASLGEEVSIAGYSTSGPYVYLFLTGPNLPANGVALHDITKRADEGFFTRVSVDGDDRWSYTWHTGSPGGRLDEGTYTVWVVSGPNDRSRLALADYRTISVTLRKPFVTVDTPVQPGGMDLHSVPDGASVTVNGEYRGKTPLAISGLSPGNYAVSFLRSGFMELSTRVRVEPGVIADAAVILQPESGMLAVNSTPPGARVLLDGADVGIAPVVLENISAGNHTVTLEMDGYIPAARQVRINAGQVTPVGVSLDPLPVPTTRAPGLVPATAGALLVTLAGIARRRNRLWPRSG